MARILGRIELPICLFVCVDLLVLCCGPLQAQTQNGSILGTVKDPSAAVVPNAKMTLVQVGTGFTRTVTSGPDGAYRFDLIPVGNYVISAEEQGFNKYVDENVHLETNETLRVDITLAVGGVAQQVVVTGRAAVITTDTGELSRAASQEYLDNRPDANYNPAPLAPAATVAATNGLFSYYGSRTEQVNTTVDGVSFGYFNNYLLGYGVQETNAETLLAPAKYQTPVTINSVTRQGTNHLHGEVEAMISNNLFQAQNPRQNIPNCTSGRPCSGFWTAGVVVGGPVYIPKVYDGRNRTFWMFNVSPSEDARGIIPVTQVVPNATLKSGNLASICNPASCTLANPFTGQPFSGNIIPAGSISPVAQALLAFYPSTNTPNGTVATVPSDTLRRTLIYETGRIDQNIGNKDLFSASFSFHDQVYVSDLGIYVTEVLPYVGLPSQDIRTGTYVFGNTYSFSPTVTNETRFGWSWEGPAGYVTHGVSPSARIAQLGLTNIPSVNLPLPITGPDISINGYTPFDGFSSSKNRHREYQLSDNLAIQHHTHTIQTGFDYRWLNNYDLSVSPTEYPSYAFNGQFTGQPFADFLLGLPGTVSLSDLPPAVLYQRRSWGAYVQDDWRATSKLTVNLGARFDRLNPDSTGNNLNYTFDPKTGDLVVPTQAALGELDPVWILSRNPVVTAATAGFPTQLFNSTNRLNPRVAFAYRPFNDQNTVIRAGYGIYVVPDLQNTSGGNPIITGGPFASSTTFNNIIVNGQPLLQWPAGYPAQGGTVGIPNVTGISRNFVYPYTQQWQLTIERAFHGQGIRVSYIGTEDTKLGYSRNINAPPASMIPFTQTRYLWPNYKTITFIDNGGTANYSGLEVNVSLRKFLGITGNIGYSWAKQMDDVPNNFDDGPIGSGINNPYCLKCEWGPAEQVPLQRLALQYVWDVPYGQGKTFGSGIPGWANHILGNWRLVGTTIARTGLYFTPIYTGYDTSNTNSTEGYPDVVGPLRITHNPDAWYDVSSFRVPGCPAGTVSCPPSARADVGRYGDAGRNILTGPGTFITNLGLFKTFTIEKNYQVVFSATSTNIFNQVNYSLGRAGGEYSFGSAAGPINSANPGFLTDYFEDWSTNYNAGNSGTNMRLIRFNVRFQF